MKSPLTEPGRRLVIAHRGASAEAPENTLEAFRLGLAQGADAFELDVRLSADGTPVVIHDPTIDRTTNRSGPVAALGVDELQRADAGGGARIPTLREVLESFPATPLLIEIKAAEAQDAVAAEIDRTNARERVVIASFKHRALERLRDRQFLIGADRGDVTSLYAFGRFHLEGLATRCLCYAVPWRWKGKLEVPRPWFIRAANRLKRPVHVWTVDDPDLAGELWRRGACGIITNKPALIKEALKPKGLRA